MQTNKTEYLDALETCAAELIHLIEVASLAGADPKDLFDAEQAIYVLADHAAAHNPDIYAAAVEFVAVNPVACSEYETLEYSVCQDCLLELANGDGDHDITPHVTRELDGKKGHFSIGIAPSDDDQDGTGYEEFSWTQCELCRSKLGGSRHGVTLFIEQ